MTIEGERGEKVKEFVYVSLKFTTDGKYHNDIDETILAEQSKCVKSRY